MHNIRNFYMRNAHNNDFQAVHRLLSLKTSKFLGPTKRKIFDPEFFFEMYSTHCFVVKRDKDDENIIGYAEVKHYPKIPALPKDCWMDWLMHHYCVKLPISISNTLFLNFLIYDTKYAPDLLLAILREIFFREHNVRFIMAVQPPYQSYKFKEDEPDFTLFAKYATTFFPKDFSVMSCRNTQNIHIVTRDGAIPPMRFRKALPEDNDEIVEIIDYDRPLIKKDLGDYYIAEELLDNQPYKTLIVTEIDNQTVGFIWLNNNVSILKIIKNFQLESYNNLLKFTPEENWKIMTHNYHDLERKPYDELFVTSAINTLFAKLPKPEGPFELKGETSALSIFSHFNMPVVRHSRFSSICEVERRCDFSRLEQCFKKFQILEDYLHNINWYINPVDRVFRLQYNSTPGPFGEIIRPNAFALQLYGLSFAYDYRQLYRFLVAAFSSRPDRDYCIFSVPSTWVITPSLKKLLYYFVRVVPRADTIIDDTLYITHRACVIGDISVYKVRPADAAKLRALLLYKPQEVPKDAEHNKQSPRKGSRHAHVAQVVKDSVSIKSSKSSRTDKDSVIIKVSDIFTNTKAPKGEKQPVSDNVSKQHVQNAEKETTSIPSLKQNFTTEDGKESISARSSKQRLIKSNPASARSSKQHLTIDNATSERSSKQRLTTEVSVSARSSKQRLTTEVSVSARSSKQRLTTEKPVSAHSSKQHSIKGHPHADKRSLSTNSSKTLLEMEADLLDELLEEVFNNPHSDYRILTICVGDSTKPIDDNEIVGFVILRRFLQSHLLNKHYILPECDAARMFCRSEIIMLKLHPLFRFESDFIFREIARTTNFWDFYYFQPLMNNYTPLTNDLITHMQPVEPRREKKIFYRDEDVVPYRERKSITALRPLHLSNDYFAVYQQNMRPTKYFGGRDRVVIIGFNNFTRAFLRMQIFYFNYKSFNTNMHCCVPRLNIIVIAAPGVVEAEQDHAFECEYCPIKKDCYINNLNQNSFINDVTYRIDLTKYVKFINGTIHKIDRAKQRVIVNENCIVQYDRLVIFSSVTFGPPRNVMHNDKLPSNYQHINNRFDKIVAYYKLQALHESLQDITPNIIVYGSHLHAFEFVNFLLLHGCKPESITLLMPLYTFADTELHLNNPYCDRYIEPIIVEMIEDLHVKVYDNIKFSHWTCYPNDENIEDVTFYRYDADEFKTLPITLKCDLFFSFLEAKAYSHMVDLFRRSGIQMRGDLIVIDEYYRTNDPRILAFGRNTDYKVELNHQTRYANPREVAEKLMDIITWPLDKQMPEYDEKFRQPSLCKVQLPFHYYMIKIISPKLYLENHLTNEYSLPLTSYKDSEFVRVRLNHLGFVQEIVAITQKTKDLDYLEFFCGKHEKLLNNLFINWTLKRIDNFLEFFQEPWTELIMHDHFSELQETNRELIINTIKDILTYKKDFDRKTRSTIAHRRLADMSVPSEIEEHLFCFLRKYRKDFHFPFALPEDFPP